jgi:lipoyl-dependent peroxiredoxin subunit D
MTLDELLDSTPAYAKDLRLNYSSLVRQNTELTPQQLWGTLVAAAFAIRNDELTAAVLEEAVTNLSALALEAAKTAAALMGMNNVYYRFQHLTTNEKYSVLPARLRMNGMRSHGVEHVDFELWCLAVSAINACGKCVDSHEKVLKEKGVTEETVAAAVRIAAVMHALGAVFDAERVVRREAVSELV